MNATVLLLSGPNLDLLGERQPLIYGPQTLDELVELARRRADTHDLEIDHVQSNGEGPLVDAVHEARGRCAGIIVNAAALTHYGWSLHDALAAFDGPVIELHISNPAAREEWRSHSVIAPVATATIAGMGADGYGIAVDAMAALLGRQTSG